MDGLLDTITIHNMTRISAEPASPSRWLPTAGGTKPAFSALMASTSSVDVGPSAVARAKVVTNQ